MAVMTIKWLLYRPVPIAKSPWKKKEESTKWHITWNCFASHAPGMQSYSVYLLVYHHELARNFFFQVCHGGFFISQTQLPYAPQHCRTHPFILSALRKPFTIIHQQTWYLMWESYLSPVSTSFKSCSGWSKKVSKTQLLQVLGNIANSSLFKFCPGLGLKSYWDNYGSVIQYDLKSVKLIHEPFAQAESPQCQLWHKLAKNASIFVYQTYCASLAREQRVIWSDK